LCIPAFFHKRLTGEHLEEEFFIKLIQLFLRAADQEFRRHIVEDPEISRGVVDEGVHESRGHEMEGAGLCETMLEIFEEDRPIVCFEGQAQLDPAAQ